MFYGSRESDSLHASILPISSFRAGSHVPNFHREAARFEGMRKSWQFRTSRMFWMRADLSLGAKGIGHILLSFADREGFAWPTTPQIAEAADVAHETADKYLTELRSAGVITWDIWKDEYGHKRRRFNLDPQPPKSGVCHGVNNPPLTSTSKQGERLFIKPPPKWDGLGGQDRDGRRTLMEPHD